MRFSRPLKSSCHSLPSPNGAFIATVFPSRLQIRSTRSLDVSRVIHLPAELAASSISWFLWSASSNKILVASLDSIRVYSPTNPKFSAHIAFPTAGSTKAVHMAFGSNDDSICVFSDFGLKLSVFNLATSRSVDINAPKFYNPGVASKGFAHRPMTGNMALLTRSGGKDVISIHAKDTLDVVRSFWPDTIDAQGIYWSVDGTWLVVYESASQGHRIFVYTADGHLFRTWNGPKPILEDADVSLGAGIKLSDWSRNGAQVAVGDYSKRVSILAAPTFTETMSILHTTSVKAVEPLQVWQEQHTPTDGGFTREFIQATQTICPPTGDTSPPRNTEPRTGVGIMAFDGSGTLLSTKMENMPSTIWIWDIMTRVLRTVLILHAPIAKATWHPRIDELLLIRCEGEESRGLVHLWEPCWEKPRIMNFAAQMPGGQVLGKTIARWLNLEGASKPIIFFSDSQDCMLASISEPEDGDLPWQDEFARDIDAYGHGAESPLNLVPADEKRPFGLRKVLVDEDEEMGESLSGGSDDMEDTFHFKR